MERKISPAPLATLRIALGLMIFCGLARFWAKGWIYELYIKPVFYFPFYGFEWVRPLGEVTYLLFAFAMVCALLVALGFYYRAAIIGLFASFTYIELIDKSTYLNHYYFVSLLCLLMIFLPANARFSLDAIRDKNVRAGFAPFWTVGALRFLVFILYFYAGLAKLNSDWLAEAMPLKIWLPARNDMPLLGPLFNKGWVAYFFSWFGCLYDLSIVFFLLNRRTRTAAYATVVIFHLMTALLFPIGMFPYVMMLAALIFFPASWHQKLLARVSGWLGWRAAASEIQYSFGPVARVFVPGLFLGFFIFQLVFPFRNLLYPGELFWSEQGYRFSWRVMLIEKAGYAQFTVKDSRGRQVTVNNNEFLTTLQEKMMATQPDMILQYAHMLRDFYARKGFVCPRVYVDSYVALNGRLGRPLVDPDVDLGVQTDSFRSKSWIIPLNDEIKGL
ncbi:HTTM domain-containing protein [Dyadobacter sp. 50-39]|uniref:HTTM domain-containing protein n=1 Tax=Dyadobacter sp. 50-39 TaxID=1895756 RepID=UPI0025C34868|nr:HTTM domain-containing protein [Dyadobacter sp. 50-39]